MLHTKFRGNQFACSGEEDFLKGFLSIYWHGGNLGHVTNMPQTKFRSLYPRRLHIKFGFGRPIGLLRRLLKMVDGRRSISIL